MTVPVIVPADPTERALDVLRGVLVDAGYPDWTAGNQISASATPTKFVRVETVSGDEVDFVADRTQVRLQFWGTTGADNHARTLVARVTAGYLAARRWRRVSGIVSLPDPTNTSRQITQFTVQSLLVGDQR